MLINLITLLLATAAPASPPIAGAAAQEPRPHASGAHHAASGHKKRSRKARKAKVGRAKYVETIPAAADPVASTSSEEAPAAKAPAAAPGTWQAVPEQTRYLKIMGTVDGVSAAVINVGGKSPACFPGKTNVDIDKALTESGYTAAGEGLTAAIIQLGDPAASCDPASRGYGADLMRGMGDADLATYIGAVTEAYADATPCPHSLPEVAQGAAKAILDPAKSGSNVTILAESLKALCNTGESAAPKEGDQSYPVTPTPNQ